MIKRFHAEDYTWDDTDTLVYKQDGSPFKDVTRQVLFNGAFDIPCQFRYFEVKPGGYSTLEWHEHTHMVMIFRGKGQALLGDEIHDIQAGDFIEVPSKTLHQFRANKGDYVGFLCLVNNDRDKVKLLNEEEMEALRQKPHIKAFLESC
ncbi:MAG: cupin domain-containing protein [Veillonella sp.]|nr:cupin domain-containing protein [Veillonella sp.]MCF0156401.1 cupin domain-containing protein [Veillonella sp.]